MIKEIASVHKVPESAGASWLTMHPDGVLVRLWIRSGAKTTKVEGVHDDRLKLFVAAPPIEGRANLAITYAIAEAVGVTKQQVRLVSGLKSKRKTALIADPNLDISQVQAALEGLGD